MTDQSYPGTDFLLIVCEYCRTNHDEVADKCGYCNQPLKTYLSATRRSQASGLIRVMTFPMDVETYLTGFSSWKDGHGNIQDQLPNLTDDEREFLMTGITAEEWDNMFPEEEDDD